MTVETIRCAICDGTETRPLYRKLGLVLVRCAACGLVYTNPRLSKEETLKRYSPEYFWNDYLPAQGAPNGRYDLAHLDHRHAAMLQLIAAQVPPPGRLVEIGAGAGFFLKAATRAGWTATGCEVSAEAVAFARERLGLDVREQSAEALDVPPASVDVLVMFDVAEHLFDPLSVFRAARRSLRPTGLLVVSTPNIDALSRWALGRDWAILSPLEHLYYYSEATLRRLLEQAGFTSITYERSFAGFGVYEAMNPAQTHSPSAIRTVVYKWLVRTIGPRTYRRVLAGGRGDTLLCLARPASA